MAVSGNLPPSNNQNATTEYFNNFYTSEFAASTNVNDAVIGYFQTITGDVDTGKTLAQTVIYTAQIQGIDPMTLIDQFKKLSDQTKLENLGTTSNNPNPNVHIPIVSGTIYSDSLPVRTDGNVTLQTIKVNLIGSKERAVVTGYEISGTLTSNTAISGKVTLISANYPNDSFEAQSNLSANYGIWNIDAQGNWNYTKTATTLPERKEYQDSITLNRTSSDKETQKITVTIDNGGGALALTKIAVDLLDTAEPTQIVGQINTTANVKAQTQVTGSSKFGTFTINSQGMWYYMSNPYPVLDPNANKGPMRTENNLNEIDAYLTVLLNTNRVNTSLLGISNTPPANKYIERAIRP